MGVRIGNIQVDQVAQLLAPLIIISWFVNSGCTAWWFPVANYLVCGFVHSRKT